jgi:hypothetical protein
MGGKLSGRETAHVALEGIQEGHTGIKNYNKLTFNRPRLDLTKSIIVLRPNDRGIVSTIFSRSLEISAFES